ncbi:thiamine pyrophosphate-requiring protein [Pigmentiphaga sp. H8]|uniref:thiamine pyrophosphate-requiring protein n=1 Tax=Pigmentiphaga sp. H8 TaxID=2488560 RepID=UPI001EE087C5|nr:thiamine pyrophosphate-requiring protein [Pigmentiphaga sp. H8]
MEPILTEDRLPSAAEQLLRVCSSLGVEYLFTNLGSDHPAFIDAFARLEQEGRPMPRIIVCPHEMTTLSAAHGYAMVTRRPQLVLVHVDVGTQNLGASVHNAARGRVPAIVVAGLSPVSTHAGTVGHRNEYIHYTQDAPRQAGIVDQYMKWCYELRSAEMTDKVVRRAHQLACSMPQGPVYLTGARETWEATASPPEDAAGNWAVSKFAGLAPDDLLELHRALAQARRPLVVTTYLGYQQESVGRLVELSERFGIGVCELGPHYLNFPGDHPHHLGYQRNTLIAEADLILMVDVDVPWIESRVTPAKGARVFHVDLDPLKPGLGYWHFPAQRSYQADSRQVLEQLLGLPAKDADRLRAERLAWITEARRAHAPAFGPDGGDGAITPVELTRAVRELVNERSIVLVEAPSASQMIPAILRMNRPGSYYGNHGAGLGWGANAAIGVKLANPDAEVITLLGDGCFMFGVPSSAYWVAGAYRAPHLTIVYNNGGWKSPRMSTVYVHPEGPAQRNDTYWVAAGAGTQFSAVAEATGGAVGYRVDGREQLQATLRQALATVRSGKAAVVDVRLASVTGQVLAR